MYMYHLPLKKMTLHLTFESIYSRIIKKLSNVLSTEFLKFQGSGAMAVRFFIETLFCSEVKMRFGLAQNFSRFNFIVNGLVWEKFNSDWLPDSLISFVSFYRVDLKLKITHDCSNCLDHRASPVSQD